VVTLIVVVVATVSPAAPLSCTVWVGFALSALSMMLAVPLTALVPGTKSKANVQLAPEARVDDPDPEAGCGQLPLLATANPAVVLGF
jgi:hypothetical protein